jgi:ABC-2 type transport system permease protein
MGSFLRQLGWELFRMYARKRTYIGFGTFLLVEALFLYVFTNQSVQNQLSQWLETIAGGFDQFFSATTMAFLIVVSTMSLLGAPFLALVSGDIVAKETEDGNLRLLLTRPVSRFRILLIKYLSCQVYALSLFVFVGVTAFGVGLINRGWGGYFVYWPNPFVAMMEGMWWISIFDWAQGIRRYFLGIFAFAIVYLPITSFAFMLSCFRIKPAAATITTIAWLMADFILSKIPFFEPYHHWLISPKLDKWLYLFRQDIPWPEVLGIWAQLIGISVTAFIIGWVAFDRRDVKS